MRFLTGLIIGAILTLSLAAALSLTAALGLPTDNAVQWAWDKIVAGQSQHQGVVPVLLPDVSLAADQPVVLQPAVLQPVDLQTGVAQTPRDADQQAPPDLAVTAEIVALQPAPVERFTEVVWMPFRSERSATGFADHISDTLDHPFTVQRESAGRYLVAFQYSDERVRDDLLNRLRTITGDQP